MNLKGWLRELCPPVIWKTLSHRFKPGIYYRGDFSSWAEATRSSAGYHDDEIIKRVAAGTDRVINGDAAFERDGVTFSHQEYPYHLLTPMLSAAVRAEGNLSVLDFGGALGSTYRQCRPLLNDLSSLVWNVIEQPNYVKLGKHAYSSDELHFYHEVEEIESAGKPNVLLFSSVLQYIPNPEECLSRAINATSATDMLIDRTPFWRGKGQRILVQEIPEGIYPGSYPLWVFSYQEFLQALSVDWRLIDDQPSPEGKVKSRDGVDFEFRNLWFRRKAC